MNAMQAKTSSERKPLYVGAWVVFTHRGETRFGVVTEIRKTTYGMRADVSIGPEVWSMRPCDCAIVSR